MGLLQTHSALDSPENWIENDSPGYEHPTKFDKREYMRSQSVFRVGKIRLNGREQFCLIRNVSDQGMMVEVYSHCVPGEPVTVNLKTDQDINGKVVWAEGKRAGVCFDEKIVVHRLLSGDPELAKRNQVPRLPRLSLGVTARLRNGARYQNVEVFDISQGGAKISNYEGLNLKDQVVMSLNGLPSMEAVVRWQNGLYAGVAFNQNIPISILATWVLTLE